MMRVLPGGEEAHVTVITQPVLREFLAADLTTDSVEVDTPMLTPALIQAIITREAEFVPLTTDGKLVHLVDRLALASRIAKVVVAEKLNNPF